MPACPQRFHRRRYLRILIVDFTHGCIAPLLRKVSIVYKMSIPNPDRQIKTVPIKTAGIFGKS